MLFFTNLFVFLLVCGSLETLPWETAAQKVHKDVAKSLEIVTTRLLAAQMRVDRHVTGRAREGLAFAVRNVHLSLRIAVLLWPCQNR